MAMMKLRRTIMFTMTAKQAKAMPTHAPIYSEAKTSRSNWPMLKLNMMRKQSKKVLNSSSSPKSREATEDCKINIIVIMKRNLKTSPNMTTIMRRVGPKVFVNCSIRKSLPHMKKTKQERNGSS